MNINRFTMNETYFTMNTLINNRIIRLLNDDIN